MQSKFHDLEAETTASKTVEIELPGGDTASVSLRAPKVSELLGLEGFEDLLASLKGEETDASLREIYLAKLRAVAVASADPVFVPLREDRDEPSQVVLDNLPLNTINRLFVEVISVLGLLAKEGETFPDGEPVEPTAA